MKTLLQILGLLGLPFFLAGFVFYILIWNPASLGFKSGKETLAQYS